MQKTRIFTVSAFVLSISFQVQASEVVGNHVDLFRQAAADIRGKTPSQIHAENLASYRRFVAEDVNTLRDDSYGRAKYLSPQDAREVLETAERNPVVSLYSTGKYDPRNEGIGFCFGRAMFVGLELVQHGFDRDSIKKAFVVGLMQTPDGASWGWHVTTIAQSRDPRTGKEMWIAIDPIVDGLRAVTQWYEEMRDQYSTDKKLKLYITDAGRFGVYASRYDEQHLRNPFYNNYFIDMRTWFDQESRTTDHYRVPLKDYSARR